MDMKIITGILTAAVLFSGSATVRASGNGGIFPYAFEERVLDNGMKIIAIPMDSPGQVAYYSIVRTGSRDEYEPGHTGFAHFFEHMMFRGTETYPGPVYDQLVTKMGADANAYTSNDITCYHLKFAAQDLEKVMELESDRFQNLSYSEQVFKTEAGAVYGEYLKGLSSPFSVLYEKLMDTAFDRHTYKHTTIGFGEDVKAMPTMYGYSKTFFDRYYRPENVILLIVGDIKPGKVFGLAEQYYGGWEQGYVPPQIPEEPEQKAERRARVAFDGKTLPILAVGYKGLAFDPESMPMAACMLAGDLIFGSTSDIYRKLVLEQQRVQFISADFGPSRDPGLMVVFAMIKDESDIGGVEKEIYRAIEEVQKNPVDENRLNALKSNMKYSFLMGLDTPGSVAGRLARIIAMSGDIRALDRLYASVDRVTTSDIQDAAKQFLVEDKRTVIILKGR